MGLRSMNERGDWICYLLEIKSDFSNEICFFRRFVFLGITLVVFEGRCLEEVFW